MKKLIALLLLLCTLTLLLSSCGSKKIEKPEDTNLEYWLLEKLDTDGCTELNAYIGSKVKFYLAKGYNAIVTEKGNLDAPESAVVYTIRKYPYTDWGVLWRISSIGITDPNVYVWGLTINSTREEFINVMTSLGFEFKSENEKYISFSLNKTIISLSYYKQLSIYYDIPAFGTFFF